MNRLTKRLNNGKELCIDVCGEQCVDGYTWCPKCKPFSDVMKKLADYEDAEEQGLLLRPKCRINSVVYALWSVPTESRYVIYPAEVKEINISSTNIRKMLMYKIEPIAFRGRYRKYYDDDFGKLVFMSQEEAEQALAKMKEV